MRKLLLIPFLLWATTALANPSNSLSLTNVVSGKVIASVTQNNNNNTTVSTYNSHTHTDIAQLGTVTVGVWNATPVQVQFGGTGKTDANSAFAALTPMAVSGDMEYLSGTTPTKLAIGTAGTFLATDGTTPQWVGINLANAVGAGTNPTVGCVTGILPVKNGGTGVTNSWAKVGTYVGNGVASGTYAIAHGLGVRPNMVMFVSTTTRNGGYYLRSGATEACIDSGGNERSGVSTDTTNIIFTSTGNAPPNETGATYVFYASVVN